MTNISRAEYITEIQEIAKYLLDEALDQSGNDKDEALELINDSLLHETIDGHQWVIYYSFNTDVLNHSNNADYALDAGIYDNESLGSIVAEQGIDQLKTVLAFWALYADIQDELNTLSDNL